MLYSIDTGQYVNKLPHKSDYERWRKNISDEDYDQVVEAIFEKIDANDINTTGWMPGHDWTGTAYQALYYACRQDKAHSGMFFGLIVSKELMENQEHVWGFGKFEKDGMPIGSMTYFSIENPPTRP